MLNPCFLLFHAEIINSWILRLIHNRRRWVLLPTVLANPYRILFPWIEIWLARFDFGNESFWPHAPGSFHVFQAACFLDLVFGLECRSFLVLEGNPEPEIGHVFDLETKEDLKSPSIGTTDKMKMKPQGMLLGIIQTPLLQKQ